jgi:hypothetical protein
MSFSLLIRLLLSFAGSCVKWILSAARNVGPRRASNNLKSFAALAVMTISICRSQIMARFGHRRILILISFPSRSFTRL